MNTDGQQAHLLFIKKKYKSYQGGINLIRVQKEFPLEQYLMYKTLSKHN